MSSAYIAVNNGYSTLAADITTSSQTTITLAAGEGARFPSPTGGDYTLITLENSARVIEIVSIVGRSTDTLTVGVAGSAAANASGRGMESTSATTWLIGDMVECRATAAAVTRGGNAKTAAELAAVGGAALIGNTAEGSIVATTVQAAINELDTEKEAVANKNATGGYAGLTLFKLNLKNAANTFTNFFTNATTAARTWTLPDKDGTVAMAGDVASPTWATKTTTYTAVTADALMANTTGGAFTITLPATPSANNTVTICDYARTYASNNLTIGRNSEKIEGIAEDMVISTSGVSITLTYIDSTVGWKLT